MPCSGLNRATSFTPGALNRASIVVTPLAGQARVVGHQADPLALQGREAVAGQDVDPAEDVPDRRGSRGASARGAAEASRSVASGSTAEATIVATS